VKGGLAVGRETASRFLEATVALEKKFLEGRQNRAEELEGAVRYSLEFLQAGRLRAIQPLLRPQGHAGHDICVLLAYNWSCLGPVTNASCGALCPSHDRECYGC